MLQPNLKSVMPMDGYKLKLTYETGEEKVFDVTPYIEGNWYSELKNKSYFDRIQLLDGGYGIEWPNGQDIAPHELYELSQSLLAWDPDFTKVTLDEAERIKQAEQSGFIKADEIDWDNLEKYN